MKQGTEYIAQQIYKKIHEIYPEWAISDLLVTGAGLEFIVFVASSPILGKIAIRTPWERSISNDNDPSLDARDLLQKEEELASFVSHYHVPVPPMFAIHLSNEIDFLVSGYIEHDQSLPDERQFGQIIRNIHNCHAPHFQSIHHNSPDLANILAERIVRRSKKVEQLARISLPLPPQAAIRTILHNAIPQQLSLLHMDARPDNLLVKQGHIRAIVDWSSALIGDPALEIARIAEYGYLTEKFICGYGELPGRQPILDAVYRLDTAIMLAIVFLSEAPNFSRAQAQLIRVQTLVEEIAQLYRH